MQPGWPSHIGTNGESIFFSIESSPFVLAWHFGEPLKAVQSKKALLPMYLSEGGIASSTRAAQFIKALTRIVWRVVGRQPGASSLVLACSVDPRGDESSLKVTSARLIYP